MGLRACFGHETAETDDFRLIVLVKNELPIGPLGALLAPYWHALGASRGDAGGGSRSPCPRRTLRMLARTAPPKGPTDPTRANKGQQQDLVFQNLLESEVPGPPPGPTGTKTSDQDKFCFFRTLIILGVWASRETLKTGRAR